MPIVDAHCDTLTMLTSQKRSLGIESSSGHLDIPRLIRGGVDVQFFAIFVGPEYLSNPVEYVNEILTLFNEEILANQNGVRHVTSMKEIEENNKAKRICAVLTIEGGEALNGKIENLAEYYRQGVRALTLTWNGRNELADGVGMGAAAGGLTNFGRQVVQSMSGLGMIIDVSHLAEIGFWDVLKEVRTPIVASHSNCAAVCDHPRNLTDQQINAIATSGGVIGVTYVPQFIDLQRPSIDRLLDHIDHLYNVGGIDCIGLGSDFDGIDEVTYGLNDASVAVPNISNGLIQRGYKIGQIEQILGGNWLRLFKEVCG